MIINERNDRKNRVLAAAGQMMTAAMDLEQHVLLAGILR